MKPAVMKPVALTLAFASSLAFAQAKTDYTLNGGSVHFHVPGDWTAIMEKSDGDPQAVIFQVPDTKYRVVPVPPATSPVTS